MKIAQWMRIKPRGYKKCHCAQIPAIWPAEFMIIKVHFMSITFHSNAMSFDTSKKNLYVLKETIANLFKINGQLDGILPKCHLNPFQTVKKIKINFAFS